MRRARAVLGTACGTHFVHDGFADILYVLFPVWAREFGLSFAQVGLMRTAYSGAMAAFQIPAGLLAERWGEARLLAAGTAATALGFIAAGFAGGYIALLGCLLAAGLGSGVQHPLSSTLVSNAYEDGRRRVALGTYNFSGDLGKVAVPAAVAFAVPWLGWRGAVEGFAAIGLAAAVVVLLALTNLKVGHAPVPAEDSGRTAGSDWGIRDLRGFQALSLIQVIDSSTRTGLLTFLPFLLIAKGSSVRAVGFALMLIFAGGAAGKFACGVLAERLGVIRTVIITEAATGAGILLLLALPLSPSLVLLPALGIALNGTSSVLYGTVADLVASDRRARSYAVFYTLGIGASALSPSIYGIVSDWGGVPLALAIVGSVVFLTLPLTLALRRPLAEAAAA
ncbi:MAG TPA: MFS transporter [Terriglobales bacterium]|nr:MFS transporter [Terriglobales bacterium]